MAIRSFRDRDTERFFGGARVSRFQSFSEQADKRLKVLQRADTLMTLRSLRSNRLEALRGDRAGSYSIRINDQWRLCFEWRWIEDPAERDPLLVLGEAWNVEIVDYH